MFGFGSSEEQDPFGIEPSDESVLQAGVDFDNSRIAATAARASSNPDQIREAMAAREVAWMKLDHLAGVAKKRGIKLGKDAQSVLNTVPHLRNVIRKDDEAPLS